MVIFGPYPLVGAPFCGAPVRPNMPNMPKSVSAVETFFISTILSDVVLTVVSITQSVLPAVAVPLGPL